MKSFKLQLSPRFFQFILLMAVSCLIVSCGDDDPDTGSGNEPISSFQFEISDTDWRVVNFSNFSSNATGYTWDFGDGESSTEESPSHTYAAGGTYDVSLTASDGTNSKSSTKTITISDPNEAIKALTGEVSKTWKLFREGISMSLGPDKENPAQYWAGLANDGSRPCAYEQEFTFHLDGTYEFNDAGSFWAEYGVFNNVAGCDQNVTPESCFDATAANMVNACGDDVSAWLSGTHAFDYDPSTSTLTLTGSGAWIGIPKLATAGEVLTPETSVSATVSFESFTGYDVMLVEFFHEGTYWPIRYASYSDASLEPELETDMMVFGEDLDDISPSELSRTFASADAADFVLLDTIVSGSGIMYGADNPDGSGTRVGQFQRTNLQYQELKFQTSPVKNDINFENMTTMSIDVYIPSTNDYSGALTRNVVLGFADASNTEQWWTDISQFEVDADAMGLASDMWHTLTFDLTTPNTGGSLLDRNDFDMFFIGFGGGDHTDEGTYFIRNLVIN